MPKSHRRPTDQRAFGAEPGPTPGATGKERWHAEITPVVGGTACFRCRTGYNPRRD